MRGQLTGRRPSNRVEQRPWSSLVGSATRPVEAFSDPGRTLPLILPCFAPHKRSCAAWRRVGGDPSTASLGVQTEALRPVRTHGGSCGVRHRQSPLLAKPLFGPVRTHGAGCGCRRWSCHRRGVPRLRKPVLAEGQHDFAGGGAAKRGNPAGVPRRSRRALKILKIKLNRARALRLWKNA